MNCISINQRMSKKKCVRMKIAFIVPIITPYRVTFFEKISNLEDVDLKVFHGIKSIEDGRPAYDRKLGFHTCGGKTKYIKLGSIRPIYYEGMYTYVKEFNPDVIVFPDHPRSITYWQIASWAKKRKKRIVIWACGWEGEHIKGLTRIVKNSLLKRFVRKASFILAYSTTAKTKMINLGVDPSRVEVAYNGIELDHLENAKEKFMREAQQVRGGNSKKILLYVGGLSREKKVNLLLKAFSLFKNQYHDIILWIIGDGPETANLKKYVAINRITDVVFLGRIIDGVDKYFAAADFFVLPGAGGLAINQAMYWGLPCIVSKADGTEDDLIVSDVTGFRFSHNDEESLCATMKRALSYDILKLEHMGQNAKERILVQSNVDQMVKTFHKYLKMVATN